MKILVIGGYGNFGKRLVKSLLKYHDHQITVAGRSTVKCQALQQRLILECQKKIEIAILDLLSPNLGQILRSISPDIVVNAAGPYQLQSGDNNYSVAKACVGVGAHYIDLADDRAFVNGFNNEFDQLAKQNGLVMIAGASGVPALTCAVMDHYTNLFTKIQSINYGISPGNRTERGEGTIGSILSYTGQSFETLINGQKTKIVGWQDLTIFDFGSPIGKRWMGNCDIPDLALLPERYPSLQSVRFQAGLEVTILHLGLWTLSFLTRMRLVRNWNRYAKILTNMSQWFINMGSNCGGMFIEIEGLSDNHKAKKLVWQLVAEEGRGPNVPTISAEILISKIFEGSLPSGARPCMGLFHLEEFMKVAERWGIYQREQTHEL